MRFNPEESSEKLPGYLKINIITKLKMRRNPVRTKETPIIIRKIRAIT